MPPSSQPTSFSITCACGARINTDASHVGRTIRCRCGRSLTIAPPAPPNPTRTTAPSGSGVLFRRADTARGDRRKRFIASEEPPLRAGSSRPNETAGGGPITSTLIGWPTRYLSSLRYAGTQGGLAQRVTLLLTLWVLVAVIGAWWFLIAKSEEMIPATVIAYGPRWLVLAPVGLVILLALVFARAALPFALLAAGIALGPFMGLRLHVGRPSAPPEVIGDETIRLLSLNADGNAVDGRVFVELLERYRPGVVAVQECGPWLRDTIETLRTWHTERYMDLCVLSRWPIAASDSMPRVAFERMSSLGYGGAAQVIRYRIQHPVRWFDFVALHLETPRKGLEGLMGDDGIIPDAPTRTTAQDGEAFDAFRFNAQIRGMESERASVWSMRQVTEVPLIVAGDFNQPVESTIFRRFWTVLDDAFERSGVGFGYTKHDVRSIRVRIDHVLFAPQWFRPIGTWVGPDVGSDHRPLIADLRTLN